LFERRPRGPNLFIGDQAVHNVVLTVQDWGRTAGLNLPIGMPKQTSGHLIENAAFATGDGCPNALVIRRRVRKRGVAHTWTMNA